MPHVSRAVQHDVSPGAPGLTDRELVLAPVDAPRRSAPPDEVSGLRRRLSSLPPPPEVPLDGLGTFGRWALAAVSVATLASLSFGSLRALFSAELGLAPALVSGFGALAVIYFAATVVQALRYRPAPEVASEELPFVTVIVPAYNEGPNVKVAIESAIASGYPLDRLEILAIDDGSRDDTWAHIRAAEDEHPDVVRAMRQPKNRGKREALRVGFVRARGAVVVTVDSDSAIAEGAIAAIVAPLVRDPSVAAVAGRVLVLNRDEGVLPRLLSARFHLTFDLARAAQSTSGAVLCTPGALSAYRTEAVLAVLADWSSQTFLGQPCTIAEDRALTTWLLRAGHRSVYQRTAVVRTVVPTTLGRAARMLVRWERGNLREDLVLLPRLLRVFSGPARVWTTLEVLFELGQYPVGWIALTLLTIEAWAHPAALASVATALLMGAAAQNLFTLRSAGLREVGWGVGYTVLASLGLWWVFPYSLATLSDGRWLTR